MIVLLAMHIACLLRFHIKTRTAESGKKFRLFRAGSLGVLGKLIEVARTVAPGEKDLCPAWQGMQYMRNMFDGRAQLEPFDNDRYPSMRWKAARDVLSARHVS